MFGVRDELPGRRNYPGFADALAAQLVAWNKDFAPLHIYPFLEGGVAYTFSLPRRKFRSIPAKRKPTSVP